jgi:inhibitor of KinA
LEEVADINGLTAQEVIDIHTSGEYLVYMIGFAPGFPYLGGMSEKIAAPRRSSPRTSIPAGSVGIAGMQTGVYPLSTPGGWQLIGNTPLELFKPYEQPPSLLRAGDIVKFVSVTEEEYHALKEGKS